MIHASATPQDEVLAYAFRRLLEHGRPLPVAELASGLGTSPDELEDVLGSLAARGRITRTEFGDVSGGGGLSVVPTAHEIRLGGRVRWTWCAWDAVGILAALRADGVVRSRTPRGQSVEVRFAAGRPPAGETVVFVPEIECRSTLDEWCPFANFFLSRDEAVEWAAEAGVRGSAVPLGDAAQRSAASWRAVVEGSLDTAPLADYPSAPRSKL